MRDVWKKKLTQKIFHSFIIPVYMYDCIDNPNIHSCLGVIWQSFIHHLESAVTVTSMATMKHNFWGFIDSWRHHCTLNIAGRQYTGSITNHYRGNIPILFWNADLIFLFYHLIIISATLRKCTFALLIYFWNTGTGTQENKFDTKQSWIKERHFHRYKERINCSSQ